MKRTQPSNRIRPLLAVFSLFVLLTAACGSDASAGSDTDEAKVSSTADAAATDDAATTATTTDAAPSRIVSLSATSTEILFAIGAGDQVVAVDSLSNYPPEAPLLADLSAFEPSLEAIAAQEPDLVVMSYDPGEIVAGLEALGIPVVLHGTATSLDDAYAQIADLGVETGQVDGAAEVVAQMRADIDEIVAAMPERDTALRIYHEVDDTFYSASSNSFTGELYTLLGLENIADGADVDGFGYPQLSVEYVIETDPQLIIITDEVGYGVDDVVARPGWEVISAVQNGNIVQVDADIASRWGPRLVDYLRVVSDAVAAETVSG